MVGSLGIALGASCGWDYQLAELATDAGDASVGDAGADAAADVKDAGPYVLPDGRVCVGHDEDGDGVPDECDNCPNVGNADQAGFDGGVLGTRCTIFGIGGGASSRAFFDSFLTSVAWNATPAGSLTPGVDSFALGPADTAFRFAVRPSPSPLGAAIVILSFDAVGGSAGVLARVTSGSKVEFVGCGVELGGALRALRSPATGCTGSACAATTLPTFVGDAGATVPYPSELPRKPGEQLGVALSLGDFGGGSLFVACRVFDPKNPLTLTSSDVGLQVTGSAVGAPTGTSVGVFADRARVTLHSIDVQASGL